MAGFASVNRLIEAYDAGHYTISMFRKVPSVTTAAGYWFDTMMSPGSPKPGFYASTPLVSERMAFSTDGGIYHGQPVSPETKHLARVMVMTQTAGAVPLPMILCDYLLYYPYVAEDLVGEEQTLTNSVSLSRHATGEGVQMMAVVVAPHGTTLSRFTVRYTNSRGEGDRVSDVVTMNNGQFVNGTILNSMPAASTRTSSGPFIPLQKGDTGVRSIQGVTILSPGDVGLFTLVLVKPIASLGIRGVDAPVEVCYCIDRPSMPVIADDACLNFLIYPAGNITSGQLLGSVETLWSV